MQTASPWRCCPVVSADQYEPRQTLPVVLQTGQSRFAARRLLRVSQFLEELLALCLVDAPNLLVCRDILGCIEPASVGRIEVADPS